MPANKISSKAKKKKIIIGTLVVLLIAVLVYYSWFDEAEPIDISDGADESLGADAAEEAGVTDGGSGDGTGGGTEGCIGSDTDGGIDYYEKGVCHDETSGLAKTDFCGGEGYLKEYWLTDYPDCKCAGYETQIHCSSLGEGMICEDGACVFCAEDSDGGSNKYIKGTCSEGSSEIDTDDCVSDSSVREYYIKGCACTDSIYKCGAGNTCVDGECISDSCSDKCGEANGFCIDYEEGSAIGKVQTCMNEGASSHAGSGDVVCPGDDICCCA